MCCSTPFFKCVEKNEATFDKGKFVPPYAQCRFANNTPGCPCKSPPCIDWTNDYKLKVKLPWSCVELTGGCSPAYKPCGPGKKLDAHQKKNWKGTPCCQWGCTCNYNQSWAAQCEPPAGLYACTKEGQKKVGHELKASATEPLPPAPAARPVPWLVAGAGTALLLSAVAVLVRKGRGRSGLYDEALVDAEADTNSNRPE